MEDENDAYFRQDNDAYINYWHNLEEQTLDDARAQQRQAEQENAWGTMQNSWDAYEATTWGVKPIDTYQFQPHNPYLHDNARTRHHSMHSETGFYEVFRPLFC